MNNICNHKPIKRPWYKEMFYFKDKDICKYCGKTIKEKKFWRVLYPFLALLILWGIYALLYIVPLYNRCTYFVQGVIAILIYIIVLCLTTPVWRKFITYEEVYEID